MHQTGSLWTKAISRICAVVFAAAAIGAIDTSVASASSGGGCKDIDGLSACISAGANLDPDIYTPGRMASNPCLQIRVQVIDLTTNQTAWTSPDGNNYCNPGHHGPWALNGSNTSGVVKHGDNYHTVVTMYVEVGNPFVATSPTEHFS